MNKHFTLALAAALLTCAPAMAADLHQDHNMNMSSSSSGAMHGDRMMVMVDHPWARASVGRNGAAYFTLVNNGKTADRLIGVKTDVARKAELHTSIMEGGVMRMRPLKSLAVPPGGTVRLKPGGHHIMLMGLKRRLKEGDTFPMTAIFEKAGQMQVSVKVGKIAAAGPMGGMQHMNMQMQGHGHTMH